MGLEITQTTMRGDHTTHTAARTPGGRWIVSWLPDRVLDHNAATTAMQLAETVGREQRDLPSGSPWWPAIDRWAGELGLTGIHAVHRLQLAPPPGRTFDHDDDAHRDGGCER